MKAAFTIWYAFGAILTVLFARDFTVWPEDGFAHNLGRIVDHMLWPMEPTDLPWVLWFGLWGLILAGMYIFKHERAPKKLAGVVVLLALTGCASGPKLHDYDREWYLDADYDSVWTAVIDVFSDSMYPIQTIEKDSGLIVSDWVQGGDPDTECDCGKGGLFNTLVSTQGKFNVHVRDLGDGTTDLQVSTTWQCGWYNTMNKRNFGTTGTSRGAFEAWLYQAVTARLGQ